MTKENDIAKVMRAERARGTRKPVHLPSLEESRDLLEVMKELIRPETTKEDFDRTMLAFGIKAGTEKYSAAWKAWRVGQQEKKRQP